jgi:hypothetical protein
LDHVGVAAGQALVDISGHAKAAMSAARAAHERWKSEVIGFSSAAQRRATFTWERAECFE